MKTGLRIKKGLAGIALAGALCVIGTIPAFAGQTVGSVSIHFEDQYETGMVLEPEVTCRTGGVSIESVEWGKDVEHWTPGKKVMVKITVSSDDGSEFAATYGSNKCKLNGAVFQSGKGDGTTMVISGAYYPVVQLDSPNSAGWSKNNKKKAVWEKSKYATGYELRLYRDDYYVHSLLVSGTTADLSEYMTKDGYYYYEVRAVGKTDKDARYRRRSEYITSTDKEMEDPKGEGGNWRTYTEGKKFEKEDGEYCKNEWYQIDGQWYFFDENGFFVKGWRKVNELWYYMNEEGIMQTGWQKIGGQWYYLEASGSMATGWKMTEPGQWYYLNADGTMAANTTVDGKRLDGTGLMVEE